MIDATVAPKVGFISPFGTTACNVNHISATGAMLRDGFTAPRRKASLSPPYFSLTTQQLGRDKNHGQKRREGL